jgi:peptidyl-prolyl cis-trans isomerase C
MPKFLVLIALCLAALVGTAACTWARAVVESGAVHTVFASASHILVKNESKSLELKATIEASGDVMGKFNELAKEHSTCPSGKSGGDLGEFGPSHPMVKEFNDFVFTTGTVGMVEGPVNTSFGYHLILITRRGDESILYNNPMITEAARNLSTPNHTRSDVLRNYHSLKSKDVGGDDEEEGVTEKGSAEGVTQEGSAQGVTDDEEGPAVQLPHAMQPAPAARAHGNAGGMLGQVPPLPPAVQAPHVMQQLLQPQPQQPPPRAAAAADSVLKRGKEAA